MNIISHHTPHSNILCKSEHCCNYMQLHVQIAFQLSNFNCFWVHVYKDCCFFPYTCQQQFSWTKFRKKIGRPWIWLYLSVYLRNRTSTLIKFIYFILPLLRPLYKQRKYILKKWVTPPPTQIVQSNIALVTFYDMLG